MPPHDLNPECAGNFATITEQIKTITIDLKEVTEIIYGNGKVGMKHQVEVNTLALATLIQTSKDLAIKQEARLYERKSDTRKWWLSQAASIITSVLVIIQTIAIAIVLSSK